MSNQPSSRNYLQAEAVDFRSPVSESVLKIFAGTQNWLLDKDTINDATIAGILSAASTLTSRVNNAVSWSITRNDVNLNGPYGSHIFSTTAREFSILNFRGDLYSSGNQFGITGLYPQVIFTSSSLHQNLAFMMPSGSLNVYIDDPNVGSFFPINEIKLTFNLV